MTDPAMISRLEALGRRGWPALESVALDGWLVGVSGAYTRRANSVAPVASGRLDLAERIDRIESIYRERRLPAVFKMTRASEPRELDRVLEARGYARDSETIVMTLDLEAAVEAWGAVESGETLVDVVSNRMAEDWFVASVAASSVPAAKRDDYRAIVEKILADRTPALFGSASEHGQIRSLALGCVIEECVSIVQVATIAPARGRRLAESVLRAILHAGREQGATTGLLSVEASNASARALYSRLGFAPQYRYAYRQREL